jgi:hypothetical protein
MVNRRGLATLIVFSLAGFITYLAGQAKVLKYAQLNDTIICYAAPGHSDLRIGPPQAYLSRLKSSAAAGAEINMTLINPPNYFARQTAETAAGIWGSLIHSDVPINVEIKFRVMEGEESGVLASTLSDGPYVVRTNGALPTRLYNASLAEKLLGRNLNGNSPDILIDFNTGFSWYYKDDGNPLPGQHDFLSVLLHEMAHGLGFSGHFLVFEDLGYQYYTIPGVFDHFLWATDPRDGKGDWLLDTILFPVPSEALAVQLQTPPIYFKGPVTRQVGRENPRMYVPTEYNRGSSIYHLHEIYNTKDDSVNAMMTFSSPPGEVIHDPGPLAKNMIYDIGWVHTYIDHDTLSDRESLDQPFTVTAKITGDEGILAGNQYLYWSTDGFQSKDSVMMTGTGNPDEFTGNIQVSSLETNVNYYIHTMDNYDRLYTSPSQAPESSHGFYVGEDTIAPVIDHIPIQFMLITEDSLYITAQITDNLGLALTEVEYKINGVDQSPIELTKDTLNNYHAYFDFSGGQVNIGDQVKYRIKAVDGSVAQNTTYQPATDYHDFAIEEIPPSRDFYENDFEEGISDFLTSEFFHDKPVGFNSFGLHSKHPYKEPNKDNTYYDFYAQLRIPIRLSSDNSFLSFDEIAYIEDGIEGTVFGDEDFFDYVIVEGSKDDGKSWHPFADGWDCRASATWFENYQNGIPRNSNDSQAIPKEEEKQYRLINMLEDPYFQAGDIVLIRFRLLSDPYAVGWGWMIDNLRIQGTTAVKDYPMLPEGINIYPVPSTGLLNVSIQMKESTDQLQVILVNLTGRVLLAAKFDHPGDTFTEQFDLSHLPNGAYLMKFIAGQQTIVKKVMLAR